MHRVLVVKLQRKKPFGRQRWEESIKTDLNETGCEGEDWIHLAQDMCQWLASWNVILNLQLP
jgi:hypothetical protein